MVYKKFKKYLDLYGPIKKRGTGISISVLRQLEELKIVKLVKVPLKSGKEPKNYNAFELTLFGRDVIRRALGEQQPINEVIKKANYEISNTKSDIARIENEIHKFRNKLNDLEKLLQSAIRLEKDNPQQKDENIDFISELKKVQKLAGKNDKLGELTSTNLFFKHLKRISRLSEESINQKLYQLFEINKLDLQMGPDNGGKAVISPSGKAFAWGKVLE